MLEAVFDTLRKATDSTMQMQQEFFKKCIGVAPAALPVAPPLGDPTKFPKKWAEIAAELFHKQRESMEAQFSTGLRNIEEAFRLAEAKDPEELRARTIELWRKTFELLRQTYEARAHEFQEAVAKWPELLKGLPDPRGGAATRE